jgi:hypothetical protein
MDPTLASVAGTAFAAGLAALYLALFRRLPPKIFGLKVFSFMGGGQSSTRETTSAERNLSRGERVFLGSIGVACWSVTGVILFIGVTRWDERRTPEDLTQPQHTDETTKNASDACPPIPPDKFLIGAYYRRLQSDPLRTQVVDQDDRDDLKHPTPYGPELMVGRSSTLTGRYNQISLRWSRPLDQ